MTYNRLKDDSHIPAILPSSNVTGVEIKVAKDQFDFDFAPEEETFLAPQENYQGIFAAITSPQVSRYFNKPPYRGSLREYFPEENLKFRVFDVWREARTFLLGTQIQYKSQDAHYGFEQAIGVSIVKIIEEGFENIKNELNESIDNKFEQLAKSIQGYLENKIALPSYKYIVIDFESEQLKSDAMYYLYKSGGSFGILPGLSLNVSSDSITLLKAGGFDYNVVNKNDVIKVKEETPEVNNMRQQELRRSFFEKYSKKYPRL